jgi:hypothetical protein
VDLKLASKVGRVLLGFTLLYSLHLPKKRGLFSCVKKKGAWLSCTALEFGGLFTLLQRVRVPSSGIGRSWFGGRFLCY